jgi:(2Fe-2S) ferredoxin
MRKPEHHIFVCGSFRVSGEPQGICHKKGSIDLLPYIENELSDRGLSNVTVSCTGCLNICDRGPAMIIYPSNWWYGGVDSEAVVDDILDALENGEQAEQYLLT